MAQSWLGLGIGQKGKAINYHNSPSGKLHWRRMLARAGVALRVRRAINRQRLLAQLFWLTYHLLIRKTRPSVA